MQSANSIQFGLKLLSVLWLMGAHLLDLSPTREPEDKPNTFLEFESSAQPLDIEYLLEDNASASKKPIPFIVNNWLPRTPVSALKIFTNLPYDPWPALSQINSYHSIVSYQYYISSLRFIF